MLIFLYGQDTFRSRQKLNEIIAHYQKTHKDGLNLKHLDLKENSYEDFQNEIKSVSMFTGKKLIIVKNAVLNDFFKKSFSKDIQKISKLKDIILFYEDGEKFKNNQFLKLLKKYSKFQEFDFLEGASLKNWIKKEFERVNTGIESQALSRLINFVGNDPWQLSGEIKKLITYKIREKPAIIEEKDIDLLVRPKIELNIFKTIDALASKNKKQALSLIHHHLEKGDSPLYILNMINFQFRNLLVMKSQVTALNYLGSKQLAKLSKDLKLHPFIIKKSFWQAEEFGLEELKSIYQKIFEKDLAVKTGKINPETALDTLIAEI